MWCSIKPWVLASPMSLGSEPRFADAWCSCMLWCVAFLLTICFGPLHLPPPPPGAMCEKYQLKMLLFQLHKLRLRNDRILCIFTACKTPDSIFLEFYCSPCQMQLALFINFNEPKCNMKNDLLYNLDIFQCAIV